MLVSMAVRWLMNEQQAMQAFQLLMAACNPAASTRVLSKLPAEVCQPYYCLPHEECRADAPPAWPWTTHILPHRSLIYF